MQLPVSPNDLHDAIDQAIAGQDPNAPVQLPWLRKLQVAVNDESVVHAEEPAPTADNAATGTLPAFLGGAPSPEAPAQPTDFLSMIGAGQMQPPSSDTLPQTPGFDVQPAPPKRTKAQALKQIILGGLEGAAMGAGAHDFGEGFQRASVLPWEIAARRSQLTQQQAETERVKAQTNLLKNTVTVRDPYGNTYQVPQGQLAGMLKTNVTEQGKNTRNDTNINSREGIANQRNATTLRRQGLKLDESGNQVPLSYDELTPAEQGVIDLKQAQADAANAQAQLSRAKNDPNSPAYRAAWGRLAVAQQNARTAAGKLGLDQARYAGDYFGTDAQGNALPGAPADENGNPIGLKQANISKPTGQQRNRADLAKLVQDSNNTMIGIIQRNPSIFGPIAGNSHVRDLSEALGLMDPQDRAQFESALGSSAAANGGVHGTRGVGAIQHFEQVLGGGTAKSTAALIARIQQNTISVGDFIRKGSIPTVKPKSGASRGKYSDLGFVKANQ
jgi:hypothetical protein